LVARALAVPQLTVKTYLEHDVSLPPTVAETLWSRPYRALSIGALMLVSQSAFEYIAVATAMPTAARSLHGLNLYAQGAAIGRETYLTCFAAAAGLAVIGTWGASRVGTAHRN
jgi:hypothetical protein